MRALKYVLITVAILALVTACGAKPASIQVQPESVTLKSAGATHNLKAEVKDAAGKTLEKHDPIVWASESDAIATVSATGVVKAVSSGQTNIKVTCGEVNATIPVTVKIIASIQIQPSVAEINAKDKKDFAAVVKDDKGNEVKGEKVKWTSSDNLIALVNDSGLVTGVKGGKATIKASVLSFSDSATVVVKDEEPGKPVKMEKKEVKKPTEMKKKGEGDKKKDDKKDKKGKK